MIHKRHELHTKGELIVIDAVIAMLGAGLKPVEIIAILNEKAMHLAWDAARRVKGRGPATAETVPGRAIGRGARDRTRPAAAAQPAAHATPPPAPRRTNR